MLVLSRKLGEEVVIGDNIRVIIVDVRGRYVRLGFTAPDDVRIHRRELRAESAAQRHGENPSRTRFGEQGQKLPDSFRNGESRS